MKTPSKIKSLFDADDDEGMFGEADDIFSASPDQVKRVLRKGAWFEPQTKKTEPTLLSRNEHLHMKLLLVH